MATSDPRTWPHLGRVMLMTAHVAAIASLVHYLAVSEGARSLVDGRRSDQSGHRVAGCLADQPVDLRQTWFRSRFRPGLSPLSAERTPTIHDSGTWALSTGFSLPLRRLLVLGLVGGEHAPV